MTRINIVTADQTKRCSLKLILIYPRYPLNPCAMPLRETCTSGKKETRLKKPGFFFPPPGTMAFWFSLG